MGNWFDSPETRWASGFVVACTVALVAYRLRAMTRSGAIAATIVGAVIVATGGWWPGLFLVVFFVTSSALSMYSSNRLASSEQVRGKRRDAVQVMANGGVPAMCAVTSVLVDDRGPWLIAMISAVAGAAADPWATEIGRFSGARPRLITSLRVAPPGTSGAISAIGTAGSLAGALLIALATASGTVFGWVVPGTSVWVLVGVVTAAGFACSIIDSVLGATIQAVYRCPACDEMSERHRHHCGNRTGLIRGRPWMSNDTVNLVAILGSAGIGLIVRRIWSWPG
ncbi:MAG: DUF92 domain-containing protein [Chloroflexia bacterium]|nr:DUF92 domain-containing protein [Chloroflexia bacterium]